MQQVKMLSSLVLVCAALTACGSTKTSTAGVPSAMTPAQVAVLADGPKPDAVYDTVDGAVIAKVTPGNTPSAHL